MKTLILAATMLVVLGNLYAVAGDDKEHPELDKKTAEVMKKVGPLYKDAKSMRAEAVIETTITPEEGDKREMKVKATIEFQRPNMFALRTRLDDSDKAGPDVVCDGKTYIVHAKKAKQYTEAKAPKGLSDIGQMIFPLQAQMTGILFQNVLAKDPAEQLLEGVTKGEHAGMVKIDGKETHHLKFEQEGMEWELWVAAEGEPWIVKASSTREGPNAKMVTVEKYTNWKLNAEPTKDVFVFKADGSEKVDSIGAPTRGKQKEKAKEKEKEKDKEKGDGR